MCETDTTKVISTVFLSLHSYNILHHFPVLSTMYDMYKFNLIGRSSIKDYIDTINICLKWVFNVVYLLAE